ncbi:RNA binding protein, heterogenous nuclear RNP-K like protein [Puccinia graminis f. sp. tritici]|uniref:RNA binding protein, heterogenous nuclear RNP-K like protein n=1 Tax=Puccinia graminis f. sp. tritici TaxID=56615 RepID=A0A5B0QDC4_PUCGR|nr:RNA binding protein, heterogenous nuclear RNP-K like protein [Puccinia graminis f. sp. tritici]KAA1138777.1 RNA binding protein, heterogenous nuclear RNP-K like protein [Puccinia graminis f. sp. tritici]
MAAVTSPTLANTASPDKSAARPNGVPINSTGAGADPASNVTLRALVSTKEAGVIIGKGGKTVAEIREQTGTKAGVSKAVQGVHDRIFSVSGGLEGVSKAYAIVAEAILQNPLAATDPALTVPPPTATTTIIRVLVSHNLMGSIIGRQGSKIKEIQDTSGVRMVASKEMLPQSTERVVEVQGAPDAIRVAIHEIGKCLMDDWERAHGTVLYQPGALGAEGPSAAYPGGVLAGGFGGANQGFSNGRRSSAPLGNANGNPLSGGARRASNYNSTNIENPPHRSREGSLGASLPPASTDQVLRTQNISIPSDMVGCIIGKGGAKINEIRRLSGSKISIAKTPHDESGERMFTIIGSPEANEKALFLLYNQLESEKERRVNTVQEEEAQ